jgi:hypothetical protein
MAADGAGLTGALARFTGGDGCSLWRDKVVRLGVHDAEARKDVENLTNR